MMKDFLLLFSPALIIALVIGGLPLTIAILHMVDDIHYYHYLDNKDKSEESEAGR